MAELPLKNKPPLLKTGSSKYARVQEDGACIGEVADSEFTTAAIHTSKLVPVRGDTSPEHKLRDLLLEFSKGDSTDVGLFFPPKVVERHINTPRSERGKEVNLYTYLESEESKLVLIEGVPGVGKTVLAERLVRDYATAKALQNYSFVVFIPLRNMRHVERMRSPEDLACSLNLPGDLKPQFGPILSAAGKRVLLIVDGFDEFPSGNRSIISSLLSRKVFSLATVVVTTRPSALTSLYKVANDRVDCHVEVLGFSSHTVYQYFSLLKQTFKDKILEYLEDFDVACELCSLPVNCSILCETAYNLPKSQTELVNMVMLGLVNRELERSGLARIGTLDSLDPYMLEKLAAACRLAYAGLTCGRYATSIEEVSHFCSSFCLNESIEEISDINVLGLLEASILRQSDGSLCPSYKFIHPVIEEYMGSLAVQRLPLLNQLHALGANSGYFEQYHKHLIEFQFGQSTVNPSTTLPISSLLELFVHELKLEESGGSSNVDAKLFLLKCISEAQDSSLWRRLASKHPQLLKVPLNEHQFSHLEMMAISLMVANSGIPKWEILVTDSKKHIAERLKSNIEKKGVNTVSLTIDKVGIHKVGMLTPSTTVSTKAAENLPSRISHSLYCKVIRNTIHRVLQLYSKVQIQSDCSETAYVSFKGCGCLQAVMETSVNIRPIPALHLVTHTQKTRARKGRWKPSETEETHYMAVHGMKSLEIILMSTPYPQSVNFVVQGTKEEVCIQLSGDFEPSCMAGEIAKDLETSIQDEECIVTCMQEQNQSLERSEMVCHPLPLPHQEGLEGAFAADPKQELIHGESRAGETVMEHVVGSVALTASFHIQSSHQQLQAEQVVAQAETKKHASWRQGTVIFTSIPRVLSSDKSYSLPDQTRILRKGGNGEIFVGEYGGVTCAIKKTTYRAREFSILTKLSHKNIVPLLAMMTGEQHPLHRRRYYCYYFMPKLTGDIARMVTDHRELTLVQLRKKYADSPRELGLVVGNIKYVLAEVLRGLCYLHSLHIVHRDIKGSNTLVKLYCSCENPLVCSCASKFSVLITDFDAAVELDHNGHLPPSSFSDASKNVYHIAPVGTSAFRPPEGSFVTISSHLDIVIPELSTSADIWSFGQLVLRMLIGVNGPSSQKQASFMYN